MLSPARFLRGLPSVVTGYGGGAAGGFDAFTAANRAALLDFDLPFFFAAFSSSAIAEGRIVMRIGGVESDPGEGLLGTAGFPRRGFAAGTLLAGAAAARAAASVTFGLIVMPRPGLREVFRPATVPETCVVTLIVLPGMVRAEFAAGGTCFTAIVLAVFRAVGTGVGRAGVADLLRAGEALVLLFAAG